MKQILYIWFFFLSILFVPTTFAQGSSFVSIVNPIRGQEFWETENQEPITGVNGQIDILKQFNLRATWLIRFDALNDQKIINALTDLPTHEKGLFLEVTPSWAKMAEVVYRVSNNWHSAGSAFLTGYERWEREKLIDTAFENFKQVFGYYPSSVGAWWVDSYSLEYMQKKYDITASLIVADQYTTDNYQIWGQFWSTPYYPSKKDDLNPAQNLDIKLTVVIMQWASRDPVNAYGNGVFESTYSVQANDYIDYHDLTTKYFSSLVDIYTKQEFNKFNQIVVGLENSYEWNKYKEEYRNQIKVLSEKSQNGQFSIVPMKDFAKWYRTSFPFLSPDQIIVADDPLNSEKKAVWFMNPFYRAGLFIGNDGVIFRDIRQYVEGEEEICYVKACKEVNFATFATRVLDEATYGHRWVIDEGEVSNFNVTKKNESFLITYLNQSNKQRHLEFLPRDISLDGKVSSIDGAILDATKQDTKQQRLNPSQQEAGSYNWSFVGIFLPIIKFTLFLILACIIPGLAVMRKFTEGTFLKIFLSAVTGFVSLTLIFYIVSFLKIQPLIFVYLLLSVIFFIRLKLYSFKINIPKIKSAPDLILVVIILAGTIFQTVPTFKSGLNFAYGLGFWGPNTHDGVWHIALINQLAKSVPPENPIFAETLVKNYHYLYDLLIAATHYLSTVETVDLVFRFYPAVFSLLLGIGTYFLIIRLFQPIMGNLKTKIAALLGLYFVYFAGSFGWIVEYLREKHIGGESAFWANQAVSFNLNPPFAISLLFIIAILHFLLSLSRQKSKKLMLVLILLIGSLIGFKSYAGVLVLSSILVISIIQLFKKDLSYFYIFIFSLLISSGIFFSNFQGGLSLILFSPFWFIHSMIDSPDRVGWTRLSLARTTSLTLKQWPKFVMAETLSLTIFIVGNLGLRIFGLAALLKIKLVFQDINLLFVLIFSILSVAIPIIFIQAGNPWNTIQFFYYFLYICAIFSGVVISSLIFKLSKVLSFLLICFVLIFTPINSLTTASGYLVNSPHAKINRKELEALRFLSFQQDGVVLTYPYDKRLRQKIFEPWPLYVYDSTAYVSALSKKTVFIEDEPQNQILITDYKRRLIASKNFFLKPEKEFLKVNHIRYIYLPKIFNININDLNNVKNIFENDEVVIYLVE